MDRTKKALKYIDNNDVGLEIGPLDHPILAKEASNVLYVDHMSLEGLKEKYKDEPVTLEKIVKPDFVLEKNNLKQATKGKKFDYVIASHVIEHVPDIVTWLQDISSVLKTDGVLSLIVPDKRYTFDITINISRPADIIGAYLDRHDRTTSAAMFDYAMECRDKINAAEVWANPSKDYSKKPYYFTRKQAYKMCLDNTKINLYVDAHCHVFTPRSFVSILDTLINYDLLSFEVINFEPTAENDMEFFVSLRKIGPNKQKQKSSLPKLNREKSAWEIERDLFRKSQLLDKVNNSLSWKLTRPLRILKSKCNKDIIEI